MRGRFGCLLAHLVRLRRTKSPGLGFVSPVGRCSLEPRGHRNTCACKSWARLVAAALARSCRVVSCRPLVRHLARSRQMEWPKRSRSSSRRVRLDDPARFDDRVSPVSPSFAARYSAATRRVMSERRAASELTPAWRYPGERRRLGCGRSGLDLVFNAGRSPRVARTTMARGKRTKCQTSGGGAASPGGDRGAQSHARATSPHSW